MTVIAPEEHHNLQRLHTAASVDITGRHPVSPSRHLWAQIACLLLPLFAHSILMFRFHNARETSAFLLVLVMAILLSYKIASRRYICENLTGLSVGAVLLAIILIAPLLKTFPSTTQKDFALCLIPASWAMLFSLIFLFYHKNDSSSCRAPLVFASALSGITVCLVIWSLGGGKYVLTTPNPMAVTDRFPYTFRIWESNPISAHYFMTFDRLLGPFENKQSYRGYAPLYTLLNYLPLRLLQPYTGLQYFNLMRLTPFFTGVIGAFLIPLSIIWTFTSSLENRTYFLVLTISTTVFLVLTPDLWTAPLTHGLDYSTPISAFLTIAVAATLVRAASSRDLRSRCTAVAILTLMALALPHHGMVTGIVILFVWTGQSRRFFLGAGLGMFTASTLSLASLYLIGRLAGFTPYGTPMLERMGFTQSFDPITALLHPSNQLLWRPYSFVFAGIVAALLAVTTQTLFLKSRRISTLVQLLILPPLVIVVLFPQSYSIHPDLYDPLFATLGPAALLFVIFGVLEEKKFSPSLYLPWLVTLLWSCVFNNLKLIKMCFARF